MQTNSLLLVELKPFLKAFEEYMVYGCDWLKLMVNIPLPQPPPFHPKDDITQNLLCQLGVGNDVWQGNFWNNKGNFKFFSLGKDISFTYTCFAKPPHTLSFYYTLVIQLKVM